MEVEDYIIRSPSLLPQSSMTGAFTSIAEGLEGFTRLGCGGSEGFWICCRLGGAVGPGWRGFERCTAE